MKKRKQYGQHALRKGRFSEPNRLYTVTTVTMNRKPFFRNLFIGRMVVKEMRRFENDGFLDSIAWVLMPDHLHWLFGLNRKASLSQIIKQLKGRSARIVNKKLNRNGPLWQKGFYDHAIRRDEDIKQAARYIIANPVRAGLVENVMDYSLWNAIWM